MHTWDQTLKAHFHVHALVPGGALADQGTRWVPTPPRFLLPVQALSSVFRAKFLDTLHHRRETLVLTEQTASLETAHGFQCFIDRLYAQAWVVYAKRSMAGPGQVLASLGRYTHRVAIANHRLIDVHHGQGRFTFRNRRQGNRLEPMTLPAHEFSRRFLLHVVPHGLQRLRHIGFLANRCKAKALQQCRQQRKQPDQPKAQQIQSRPGTTGSGASRTPLEALDGIITPSGLHFERHHSGVPDIDPATHRLLIQAWYSAP